MNNRRTNLQMGRRITIALAGFAVSFSGQVISQVEDADVIDEPFAEYYEQGVSSSVKDRSRYIEYPNPYVASVETFARLMGKPRMEDFSSFLRSYLELRVATFAIETDRSSAKSVRMRIFNTQSLVLRGHRYWEYIFLTASLSELDELVTIGDCRDNVGVFPIPSSAAQQVDDLGTMGDAACTLTPQFEFVLTVSGKYKAGGRPADVTGYDDMITEGYGTELDLFADLLTEEFVTSGPRPVEACWSDRTGQRHYPKNPFDPC